MTFDSLDFTICVVFACCFRSATARRRDPIENGDVHRVDNNATVIVIVGLGYR
jgi:hypothetical protein